jgi:two-component system, sensor histidine kinase and response regulator
MDERPKILIVDDRKENLLALEKILAGTGSEVIPATSGDAALTATLDHTFALAILDVQMPVMNGFELAELLRGDPKTRGLHIIFLTAAMLEEHYLFQGYEAGAVDYLVKPFEPAVLLSKVRVFLELDSQRSELIRHRERLEELVRTRTAELEEKNRALEEEIANRGRLENDLRRRTEELQRANEDLEQFVRVASHDFQEPIRAVIHYTQRLEELYRNQLDEDTRSSIDHAVQGARRIHSLINDYLAFSSLDLSHRPFQPVACGDLAQQIVEERAVDVAACGVVVEIGTLPVLEADARQLNRLFRELLDNALKFRGEDPLRIEVTAEPDGASWRFRFTDNGIGIDPRFHERVFRVFQRLHARGLYPGNGIGLAIVRKIVERHGGKVRVESEPGQGTSVCFTLGVPATE